MSIKLPDGITIEMLKENWDKAQTQYTRAFRKMQLLDATDRDRLWEAIKAKFPEYQILPHTNHITYVKENIHASIYTVGKLAHMVPSTEEDAVVVTDINILLEHL
jgi:hypothetical protein